MSSNSPKVSGPEDQLDPYRLPRHIVPHRYEIELEPQLAEATFAGQVTITAEVMSSTRMIVLNSKDLEIISVFVDGLPRHSDWTQNLTAY